jgi:ABC-type uncharacterized transport system ATPase component
VSLLMASLHPSRILLLDEHTAALDEDGRLRARTHRAHRRAQSSPP